MKRMIALFLSICMVACVLPFGVLAADNSSRREALLQRGCDAFPEFKDKILADTQPAEISTFGAVGPYIVFSDTRAISETEELQYTEYSDGTYLLSSFECKPLSVTVNSHNNSSQAVNYDVTLEATMSGIDGYFRLRNLKFSLINGQYDCITNKGSPSRSGSCTGYSETSSGSAPLYETASESATVQYRVDFQYGSSGKYTIDTLVTFRVGNNTYSHDFSEYAP